jgi:hypothetical protein
VRGSGDLLSRLPVHAGAQDGEGYDDSVVVRRGKTLARLDDFLAEADGSYIYKEVKLTSRRISDLKRLGLGFRFSQS